MKGERETSCLSCGTKRENEAGRQGMMLMGHGEDDAGTSEAVIDSGGGGESWRALDKTWGKVRAGALPSLGCWQIQRLAALRALPRTGEEAVIEELWSRGRARTQRSRSC